MDNNIWVTNLLTNSDVLRIIIFNETEDFNYHTSLQLSGQFLSSIMLVYFRIEYNRARQLLFQCNKKNIYL